MSPLHNRQTHCQNKNAPIGLFQSHTVTGSKMINLPWHLSNTLLNCLIIPCLRWSPDYVFTQDKPLPAGHSLPINHLLVVPHTFSVKLGGCMRNIAQYPKVG